MKSTDTLIGNDTKNEIYDILSHFLKKHLESIHFRVLSNFERCMIGEDGGIISKDFFEGTHKDIVGVGIRGYLLTFSDTDGESKKLVFLQEEKEITVPNIDYILTTESIQEVLQIDGLKDFQTMMMRIKKLDVPKSNDTHGKTFEKKISDIIPSSNT